ncbi:MAG: dethiobiotin synthase [Methylophaga sp.]|nr:MAG: dethiobiotin synthase [Methylophaga sp.]
MTSIFVTGTDTGVGKTGISVALIELLQQQGFTVAGMKPIASGCEKTIDGLRNGDAVQLMQQANIGLPYELINPYAFEPAIAPHIAAKQAGIEIDLKVIQQHYQQIQQQVDAVVVEGAGGWLVPLNQHQTMADLAVILDLPVILVVGIRLGCINHALLTVKAIESTGLKLQGWIANHPEASEQTKEIVATLKLHITAPCLGNIPVLSAKERAVNYLVDL